MDTATLYDLRPIGTTILATRITPDGTIIPARRLVRADGTPRSDLIAVRVIRVIRWGNRRLTLDQIRDGVRPLDRSICEVLS